jgi:hypothetical protein
VRYRSLLGGIQGLELPAEPDSVRSDWQSCCVRLPEGIDQKWIVQTLLDNGIATRRGIMCIHRELLTLGNAGWLLFELSVSERAGRVHFTPALSSTHRGRTRVRGFSITRSSHRRVLRLMSG